MSGLRVLAAPDKFRGTATAPQVADCVATAVRAAGGTCRELPLADGGEGTLYVFGGPNRATTVTGPLGGPVDAGWRLDGDRAVIEMATASGLLLAGGAVGNDPMAATTRGTGELIAAAVAAGARLVLVGVGGSATTDGGEGALQVLAAEGRSVVGSDVRIRVCADVRTHFLDAAAVFGPQKGARPAQVCELTRRLERLRAEYVQRFGVDVHAIERSGAAGGLAGGLAAIGAELVEGFDTLADAAGLDSALDTADLVVTGEGRFDAQSLDGKVVGGVIERTRARDLPVLVVAGSTDPAVTVPAGVTLVSLVDSFGERAAFGDTLGCIERIVLAHLVGAGAGPQCVEPQPSQ